MPTAKPKIVNHSNPMASSFPPRCIVESEATISQVSQAAAEVFSNLYISHAFFNNGYCCKCINHAAEYHYSIRTVPLSLHRVSERLRGTLSGEHFTLAMGLPHVWVLKKQSIQSGRIRGHVAFTYLPVLNVFESTVLVRLTTCSFARPLTGARRGNMAGRSEILATLQPASPRGTASLLARNTRLLSVAGR